MVLKKINMLWDSNEISNIFKKNIEKDWICNGVEIDSRKVKSGNTFLALPGTKLDGHSFIKDAINLGARSLIIKESFKIIEDNLTVIEVDDVYKSLILLAKASRKRINNTKNIIAITGSSGKTSTKEMIGKALSEIGSTYINPASYNNYMGVPYSLANMPRNTDYGVFELGMNNLNEISILSELVQPDIAIITNISEAHIGNFSSVRDIIKAKSEIFDGLRSNGYVLLNNDHTYYKELVQNISKPNNYKIIKYGFNKNADIRLLKRLVENYGQTLIAEAYGKTYKYKINLDGEHQAINSLAVLGVLLISKCNVERGLKKLYKVSLPPGRGRRHNLIVKGQKSVLIDDTYNANLSSMVASLKTLYEIAKSNRKVLFFGEMSELGIFSDDLHKKLYDYLISFNISVIIFVGNKTKSLYKLCNKRIECLWSKNIDSLSKEEMFNLIKPKDFILVKGSRNMNMEIIVKYLLVNFKGK